MQFELDGRLQRVFEPRNIEPRAFLLLVGRS